MIVDLFEYVQFFGGIQFCCFRPKTFFMDKLNPKFSSKLLL